MPIKVNRRNCIELKLRHVKMPKMKSLPVGCRLFQPQCNVIARDADADGSQFLNISIHCVRHLVHVLMWMWKRIRINVIIKRVRRELCQANCCSHLNGHYSQVKTKSFRLHSEGACGVPASICEWDINIISKFCRSPGGGKQWSLPKARARCSISFPRHATRTHTRGERGELHEWIHRSGKVMENIKCNIVSTEA